MATADTANDTEGEGVMLAKEFAAEKQLIFVFPVEQKQI